MVTSRPVPQQTAQIFSPLAGQKRAGLRFSQIRQDTNSPLQVKAIQQNTRCHKKRQNQARAATAQFERNQGFAECRLLAPFRRIWFRVQTAIAHGRRAGGRAHPQLCQKVQGPPRLQKVTVIDDSELVCLSGAKAGGYDVLIGLELISEIGHGHTESLRIAVRAVAGALLRAERAGEVVIDEGNVGAVLRVESYLEEVCKSAAVAVGATGAVGANGSSVNEMIAGRVVGKVRDCGVFTD